MTSQATVRRFMTTKVVTLEPTDTLGRAEQLMLELRIRHLPVVEGTDRLLGLVTHRDLLRAQRSSLSGGSDELNETLKRVATVREIMTSDVLTVPPDLSALDAATTMRDSKLGCLPVVEDGRLIGIVTETDFLDVVIQALRK